MGGKSEIKRGKLSVKIRGLIKDKHLPEKWVVLYDGSSDQKLPRLELFDKEEPPASSKASRVIILENVKWVDKSFMSKEQPYFELSIRREKHYFLAESESEKETWVSVLCIVCNELAKQRANEIDLSYVENSETGHDVMSDNTLYDTSEKALQFKISIDPTKASEANNLRGNYLLMPTQDSLQLLESTGQKCICDWQYRQIRKFGKSKQCFRMEVGRTSSTGEGEFVFFTVDGESIVHFITMYTRLLQQRDLQKKEVARQTAEASGQNFNSTLQPTPAASSFSTVESRKEVSGNESPGISPYPPPVRPRSCTVDPQGPARPNPVDDKAEKGKTRTSSGKGPSAEVKIYETSSGLTAPLVPELHSELQKKMKGQKSGEGQDRTSVTSSASPNTTNSTGISWPEPGDSKDYDTDERANDHTAINKEKKRSEKESKKKREKEEKAAEARKKKEIKEQKEKDKKSKKDKGHEKVQPSKSLPTKEPSNVPFSDGHIYDEPEVLVIQRSSGKQQAHVKADLVSQPADLCSETANISKSVLQDSEGNSLYASPIKPDRDAWKVHARPDSAAIHQEDYNQIRIAYASQRQHSEPRPAIPPYLSAGCSEAEVYDHLGNFDSQSNQKLAHAEGIYGLASAVQTVKPKLPPPMLLASLEVNMKRLMSHRCLQAVDVHHKIHQDFCAMPMRSQKQFSLLLELNIQRTETALRSTAI
ncbi:hypothetical protein C0Q70_09794 [Pomacea canaliculata]|uniref:IRS-type PTB domain-containing protein n=1 Tax=Pomacea canaliculata TaxID=400727 RepID=A0A2T7PAU0_POMCA|nr:hypothetical protein C0Q70_09794 [Pomacea canaliculata]